jgi:protein-S-isoprenylcysteine O-methyltransferase Ste14
MPKLNKIYYSASAIGYSLLPLMVLAQGQPGEFDTRIAQVMSTLRLIIALLFVIATLIFLWGVIQFIASSADQASRDKAKGIMTWGIIGLAVMAVAWGITTILVNYFGIPTTAPIFRQGPSGPF